MAALTQFPIQTSTMGCLPSLSLPPQPSDLLAMSRGGTQTSKVALSNVLSLFLASSIALVGSIAAMRALTAANTATALFVPGLAGGEFFKNTADTTTGWAGTGYISGNTFEVVTSVGSRTPAIGDCVAGNGYTPCWITAGSGTTWTVNGPSQSIISTGPMVADNGVTKYVDSAGNVWDRSYTGLINGLWAGITGNPGGDDTANLQGFCTYLGTAGGTGWLPADSGYGTSTAYKISGPINYDNQTASGGFLMEASLGVSTGSGCITPTGSGYVAFTMAGAPQSFTIAICGTGNAVDGFVCNNPILAKIQQIRVYGLQGYGFRFIQGYDCHIEAYSIQNCGTATKGAFSVEDGAGTTNECIFGRGQIENCTGIVANISPNTVTCKFGPIHTEGGIGVVNVPTWTWGGSGCQYDLIRQTPSNSLCSAAINGAYLTMTNLRSENFGGNSIPISIAGENNTPVTLINPYIQGSLSNVNNQGGIIQVINGSINTVSGQIFGHRFHDVAITNHEVDYCNYNVAAAVYDLCTIAAVTSTNTTSAATYRRCAIAECNSLLTNTILDGCTAITAGTFAIVYGQRVAMSGGSITPGSGGFTIATGGILQMTNGAQGLGAAAFTAPLSSLIDDSSFFSGAVTGFVPPSSTLYPYYIGQRTKNPAPASGQPKAWVCTVAGSPGTWTSEGNL